jgi:CSLREA domain-containing protein
MKLSLGIIIAVFVGFALADVQPIHATTITVQSTGDGAANAANCPGASCRLRDALAAAADSDTIDFSVVGTILLTSGQLTVDKSVTISGPGANMLAVNGNGASRIFYVTGNSVILSGLTITNGNADLGGGIDTDSASLTVSNCTISGSSAIRGGGIFVAGGQLTVSSSTFRGNSGIDGGGMDNVGVAIVNNSTFSGNSAGDVGGGIRNDGQLTVSNCTFSGNSAVDRPTVVGGGAIDNLGSGSVLDIEGTILNKGGASGQNIRNDGTATSHGYNLSSDAAGGDGTTGPGGVLNGTGDIRNTDPKLGGLAYYGGPTATHIPKAGSPAIDAGDPNFTPPPNYDQRGFPFARVVNSRIDIGAFERQPSDIDPTLVVTTTADTNTNSTCDPASPCSLRDAITAANAPNSAPDDVIYFAVTGKILLTSALPNLDSNMKILGPGANVLTVQRSSATQFRIFTVNSGKIVTISGLTITNGSANAFNQGGGGISNDHGTLTVSNCTVSGNSADIAGGIDNNGDSGSATMTIVDSTISGNSGITNTGGIRNEGVRGTATLNIRNSTLSGNSGVSGAILNDGQIGSASLEVINSTLSGNSGGFGRGGISNSGSGGSATTTIGSTLLKAGASGANITNNDGTITSDGYNLSSDAAGGDPTTTGPGGFLNGTGDIRNTNPMLGPLQDNGGPTFTHELLTGSPAIDQGNNFTTSATDQRGPGFDRTFNNLSIDNADGGDGTDIGAFEVQNTPPSFTSVATVTRQQGSPSSNSQIATVTDAETPAGQLTVSVVLPLPTGITVTNIQNTNGTVTADVAAGCDAALGSNTVTLQVSDGQLTASGNLTVNVTANSAPVITLKSSPVLNTPNHKYHTFNVSDLATATDDSVDVTSSVVIVSASSDEKEDAKGNGDGATKNDIVIATGCKSIKLRAERASAGNGRVYRVNLCVTDSCGASSGIVTATVFVPNNGSQIDDGPSGGYTVPGCSCTP